MNRLVPLLGVALLAGAQGARELAKDELGKVSESPPFAPSAEYARLMTLGYPEVAADLLFFRLVGYFGGKPKVEGIEALVDAIVALDPHYYRIYEWGARAMTHGLTKGVSRDTFLHAIRVLEIGMKNFPTDYKMPRLAGEMYLLDLQTKDPSQRRRWDEEGIQLLESAVRKPDAPASTGTWVAFLRTKLGQKQRAIDGLRELILITDDLQAREQLLEKLAELEGSESSDLASELFEERKRFEEAWRRDRPFIARSLYIVLGPPPRPGFDMSDLATGGHDVVGIDMPEQLEPVTDKPDPSP